MRDEAECYTVPDHQEIYLDEATRDCCIVEIVEHNSLESAEAVCRFYVEDLARMNEATSVRDFEYIPSEGCEATPALRDAIAAQGGQRQRLKETTQSMVCRCELELPKDISRDGETGLAGRTVFYVLVVQVREHGSDVVVTFKGGGARAKGAFDTVCATLNIRDFSLFGG